MIVPCKGCKNRETTCHVFCELYKEWSKQNEKVKRDRHIAKEISSISFDKNNYRYNKR